MSGNLRMYGRDGKVVYDDSDPQSVKRWHALLELRDIDVFKLMLDKAGIVYTESQWVSSDRLTFDTGGLEITINSDDGQPVFHSKNPREVALEFARLHGLRPEDFEAWITEYERD